jgi:hypothetical protein
MMNFDFKKERIFLIALGVIFLLFILVLVPLRNEIADQRILVQKTFPQVQNLKLLKNTVLSEGSKKEKAFGYSSTAEFSEEIRRLVRLGNLSLSREIYQGEIKGFSQMTAEIVGSPQNLLNLLISLEHLATKLQVAKCEFKNNSQSGILRLEIRYRISKS